MVLCALVGCTIYSLVNKLICLPYNILSRNIKYCGEKSIYVLCTTSNILWLGWKVFWTFKVHKCPCRNEAAKQKHLRFYKKAFYMSHLASWYNNVLPTLASTVKCIISQKMTFFLSILSKKAFYMVASWYNNVLPFDSKMHLSEYSGQYVWKPVCIPYCTQTLTPSIEDTLSFRCISNYSKAAFQPYQLCLSRWQYCRIGTNFKNKHIIITYVLHILSSSTFQIYNAQCTFSSITYSQAPLFSQ